MSRQQAITEILSSLASEQGSFDDLIPAVYDELRRLARAQLRKARAASGQRGFDTTELVHEAYFKLSSMDPRWQNRRHFFATAAKVMRHLLTDAARLATAGKRGADAEHVALLESDARLEREAEVFLAIDAALAELGRDLPRLAQVVEYRFFAGLTEVESADILGMSPRTVRRDWVKARAWLHRFLRSRDVLVSADDA